MATEYGKLNFTQRAHLKKSDPARFEKIKAQHQREADQLLAKRNSGKTAIARAETQLEILQFHATDVTSHVSSDDVEQQRQRIQDLKAPPYQYEG